MSNLISDFLGTAGASLTEAVTVYHPAAYQDGQVSSWNAQSADALILRHENALDGGSTPPRRTVKLTILLPETPQVVPGDQIEYAGTRYRVSSVAVARSLTGSVVAQRCQVE